LGKSERQQVSLIRADGRSTGIDVNRAGQAEPPEAEKFYGGVNRVSAAV
jgi:hypothetical protein